MSSRITTNSNKNASAKQMNGMYPKDIVDFDTWMPPRKRAKTEEEKEIRKLQRVLRNRRSSRQSRDKKRRHVDMLEKHCSVMRKIIEELQYKLNIGSLISEKETWNTYLKLQQHDFLSSSPLDVRTFVSEINTGSTSRLDARYNNESTILEENKRFPESTLEEKSQTGTNIEGIDFQSTMIRGVEQLTPLDYGYSAQSSLPSIQSPDCESDNCKNTIAESTPVSLGTSISENFNNKSTREGFVSNTMMPWFFFPPECQSTNLNFDNKYLNPDGFEGANTNEDSLGKREESDHNFLFKDLY
ncbi:Transcriptional activator HAC1 [Nakaseomyces bracarensis]|uniref:Transcriptional activator HAC1 n=1 Tax=Nakaseomyces bracarensis TaxID=273131 RepID=A0ABR4NRH3_9SACH